MDLNSFTILRDKIRQSGEQYRYNNDTSKELFHPDLGFTYAYNIPAVEQALDEYALSLPSEYHKQEALRQNPKTMEESLQTQARYLLETSSQMETRDLARTVLAYIAMLNAKNKGEILQTPFPLKPNKSEDTKSDP